MVTSAACPYVKGELPLAKGRWLSSALAGFNKTWVQYLSANAVSSIVIVPREDNFVSFFGVVSPGFCLFDERHGNGRAGWATHS